IVWPVVAGSILWIPARDEVTRSIELEHLRRRKAARARPRLQRRSLLARLQRLDAAMDDPDVILRVGGDTRDRSEDPMFRDRKRLRPERIDLELWPLRRACAALRRDPSRAGGDEHVDDDRANDETTFHEASQPGGGYRKTGIRDSGFGIRYCRGCRTYPYHLSTNLCAFAEALPVSY